MGIYEGSHIVRAIREIRNLTGWDLRQTLIFVADAFGFKSEGTDQTISGHAPSLNGWRNFTAWRQGTGISFESVQGPHAMAILKAIAAKHRASTGRSE